MLRAAAWGRCGATRTRAGGWKRPRWTRSPRGSGASSGATRRWCARADGWCTRPAPSTAARTRTCARPSWRSIRSSFRCRPPSFWARSSRPRWEPGRRRSNFFPTGTGRTVSTSPQCSAGPGKKWWNRALRGRSDRSLHGASTPVRPRRLRMAKNGKDPLVIASKAKGVLKKAGCNTAGDAFQALNGYLYWLLEQAAQRASDELRGDVLAQEEVGEHRRRQRLQVGKDRHARGGQVRERPVPEQVRY